MRSPRKILTAPRRSGSHPPNHHPASRRSSSNRRSSPMAGMGATGAGLNILGGIMGSVGDILASEKYKRPKLPPATGYEQRLRQLAQDQLIGGGQELLQGQALYNQMTPYLLGMLPGMTLRQTGAGMGGATGGGGAAGTAAGTADTGAPVDSYSQGPPHYQQAGRGAQQAAEQDEQAAGGDEKGPGKGGAPQAAERAPPSEESAARRSGSRAADVLGGLAGTDVRHLDGRHLADGCGADGKCR